MSEFSEEIYEFIDRIPLNFFTIQFAKKTKVWNPEGLSPDP